jgi:hypothetical protein
MVAVEASAESGIPSREQEYILIRIFNQLEVMFASVFCIEFAKHMEKLSAN